MSSGAFHSLLRLDHLFVGLTIPSSGRTIAFLFQSTLTHDSIPKKEQQNVEDQQQTRYTEMAYTFADLQPTTLISDQKEETQGENVRDGQRNRKKSEGRKFHVGVEDGEDGGDNQERNQQFIDEKGRHEEWIENRYQAVDGFEVEG